MKKFLWTLLIILLILGGGFTYLYFNPTSTLSQKILPMMGIETSTGTITTTNNVSTESVVIVSSMPKADILPEDIATFHDLFKKNNLTEDSRLVLVSVDKGDNISLSTAFNFKQQLNGVGVDGEQTYSFYKSTDDLRNIMGGSELVSKDINTTPKISASEAVRIVNSKSQYKALYKQAELFIHEEIKTVEDDSPYPNTNPNYIKKKSWFLAWKITPLNTEFPVVLVNAETGDIFYQWNGVIVN